VVKNTKIGTRSDQDGTFTLSNVPVNGQVVVSHVSYKSVALDIDKAKTDYQIELTPASILTSEVVVVSYIPINTSEPSAEQKSKSDTDKSEFVIVEQNAEFPGGEREMMMYLGRNIKYPTAASKKNVSGTVLISFEVGKHGNISKPEVVKGLGYGLDDEAVRVVWNMPKWIPAKQNGENVAVQYTIPIQFKLESSTIKTNTDKPKEDKEKRQGFISFRTFYGSLMKWIPTAVIFRAQYVSGNKSD
jgi:TonB family protein